jgi:hypothetical protein
MPHLIHILLPLYDNTGNRFHPKVYSKVRADLIERFGGLTAYSRAPAEGLWDSGSETKRDDIVVFEVMIEHFEPHWWRDYRAQLEGLFRQNEIIVRAQSCERL